MTKHALHHSAVALISALALTGCPETNDPESEAGATAGTAAGATAGTTAGTVAGTMTMPPMGGAMTMPPAMDLSCAETVFCAIQCAPTDTACQEGCINAVSAADAPILDAYGQCLQTNMCQDEACVQMNCSAQYEACIPPGMSGCGDVFMCLSTCREEQCAFNCQIEADAEAQQLLTDLVNCMQTNNCMGNPNCTACSPQLSACQAD